MSHTRENETMKKVEVLFFGGCPHVGIATDRARQAIESIETSAELHLVRIEGEADAVAHGFLGSPTIRVDGADVDGSAHVRTDFGLQCRVYSVDGRLEGAPPLAWIESALRGDTIQGIETQAALACCSDTDKGR